VETVVGVALVFIGAAGIAFRRVFRAMADSPGGPAVAGGAASILRWWGWLALELGLVVAGTAFLAYGVA